MNELIDKFLFELFDGLRDKTTVLFGEFIADAQALAAIFMLLYFGVESFKMMSGDKKLEISRYCVHSHWDWFLCSGFPLLI